MSRTLSRALSLGVLAVTGLLFAAWWLYLRAPVPEKVCAHVVAITERDAVASGLAAETRERMAEQAERRCTKLEADRIQLRGRLIYAEHAKCVMRSTTLAEINRC